MHNTSLCNRIQVFGKNAAIKIKVTPVLRGSIHPPVLYRLSPTVEDKFGSAEMRLLHFAEIYGGKICAALDRQHPRDLFDVKCLLSNEGITEDLKNCFLVYLISHNRPMVELLDPTPKDIQNMYDNEFIGMTNEAVSIDELYDTRDLLLSQLHELINDKDWKFLLSMKSGMPNWELFSYPDTATLPAIQWKLHNISKMPQAKKIRSHSKLRQILQTGSSRQPMSTKTTWSQVD